MSKPIPGQIRNVWGPYSKGKRWQVRVSTADGKQHARTFTSVANARAFAADCRDMMPQEQPQEAQEQPQAAHRAFDGKHSWWSEALGSVAQEAMQTRDKDTLGLLRALAQAAKAADRHISTAELEDRLGKVEEQQKLIHTARKVGARNAHKPSNTPPKAGEPVR